MEGEEKVKISEWNTQVSFQYSVENIKEQIGLAMRQHDLEGWSDLILALYLRAWPILEKKKERDELEKVFDKMSKAKNNYITSPNIKESKTHDGNLLMKELVVTTRALYDAIEIHLPTLKTGDEFDVNKW